MVNEVNKLIFNTLVEQGAVYIPNLCTLSICRTPSRKRGRRVVPPSYSVSFTTECKASSLSDVIVAISNVSGEFADDIVSRWQKRATTDGRVVIEGIGTIYNGVYTPDKELISKLNINTEAIDLKGKSGGKKWALVLGIIIAICALGIGLYNIVANRAEELIQPAPTTSSNDLATPSPTTETEDIVVDDTATPIIEEEIVDVQEEATIEEPISEANEPVAEVHDWRVEQVRHYVIFGSYSTIANANNAVSKIERRNPAVQCKVIRIGAMYGIAVFGSSDHNECVTFKRQNRALYKDAWIHSPKH